MPRKKQTKKSSSSAGKTSGARKPAGLSHAVFVLLFFLAFSIFGLRHIERFLGGWPPSQPEKPVTAEKRETISARPKVVLIIDDLGFNKEYVDRLLRIGQPINMSVLPHLPYSKYSAEASHRKGMDVLLHLPMEPKVSTGYTADDSGEGVLLLGRSLDQIRQDVERNILAVPNIAGVNNHMGSKFMENEQPMKVVMAELRNRGLYFVDSLTTKDSLGREVATKLGVRVLVRDVFIDRSPSDVKYTKQQLDKLVEIAEKKGLAVGIGHPYPKTIDALERYAPKIAKQVDFVKISSGAFD